ncbi:sensor histidine kinase [Tsuneonella suprasediminis]|uniref:histidine kinase n=1 Tax=Tsuneonella suprasediminis TaxID=2306996 RepID=A0A419R1T9_9SPHN|nr:histidine kinase dimerization/phospho-acceptor domain-containing protein [Tsuneonella suprasediminis]RJX67930.1 sensor histidine kinase [Tsuneonella suprasediminis]
MQIDDRLATVLRHRAASERAARTQYRQLLDLLGARRTTGDESMLAAAWLRLAALGETIPVPDRAAMIREPGLRFRNPELALHLADDEPEVAASALAVAQLSVDDWEATIPRLPVRARGFLRLRRDLPPGTQELLERLGIRDRGLPSPDIAEELAETEASTPEADIAEQPGAKSAIVTPIRPIPANDLAHGRAATAFARNTRDDGDDGDDGEIGALVRRIESFRKARSNRPQPDNAPRLPLGEKADNGRVPLIGFAFTTDSEGRIDWAERNVAPMVVGAILPPAREAAKRHRQPLRHVELDWEGAPMITGNWIVDAAPRFTDAGGRFYGYAGRFRRPPPADTVVDQPQTDRSADLMRQLLHELKTPVNAIQGFAEVIQQQLFGPTPHEYRALAATIAGDAARMLAGFDELDRLARLESGALELQLGHCDFAEVLGRTVDQLQDVLKSRGSAFELDQHGTCDASVPLACEDAEALAWRLLATLAGSVGTNERLRLEVADTDGVIMLSCDLPAAFAARDDIFADSSRATGSVSAGMFGTGFALRLARAETRAIHGDLHREGSRLILLLPHLAASQPAMSATEA